MHDAQGRRADAAVALDGEATARPSGSSLRIVALRSTTDPSLALRFHPRLTVVTGFGSRPITLISDGVRLARGGAASGIVELDGALVPISRLPADLAALSPRVVGTVELRAALEHLAGATRDRLDDELDATAELVIGVEARCIEASGRIEAIESGIRSLEQAIVELAERREETAERVDDRPEGPEAIEALLAAAEAAGRLPKMVHPEAEELAREWEAFEAASAVRRARNEIAAELRSCEDTVRDARDQLLRLRTTARQPEPSELAEAVRLRQAWTVARVRAASRFAGVRREQAVERARAAYDAHLRRFGVSNHQELTALGTRSGSGDVEEELRATSALLVAAERRCEELRWLLRAPDDEREATRIVLRARARRILGREPGRDVAAELREFRIDPPEHVQAQVALAAALRGLQIRVETTLEDAAHAWIDSRLAERGRWEERQSEVRRVDSELAHRRAELAEARRALLDAGRELERLTAELEDLRFEQRRLEARRDEHEQVRPGIELDEVTPAQIPHLLHIAAGLDPVSAAGERPVVVDDPFGDVDPRARRHVLSGLLSLAGRVQVIVLTDDAQVVEWARRAGEYFALVWSPAALDEERASHSSTRTGY